MYKQTRTQAVTHRHTHAKIHSRIFISQRLFYDAFDELQIKVGYMSRQMSSPSTAAQNQQAPCSFSPSWFSRRHRLTLSVWEEENISNADVCGCSVKCSRGTFLAVSGGCETPVEEGVAELIYRLTYRFIGFSHFDRYLVLNLNTPTFSVGGLNRGWFSPWFHLNQIFYIIHESLCLLSCSSQGPSGLKGGEGPQGPPGPVVSTLFIWNWFTWAFVQLIGLLIHISWLTEARRGQFAQVGLEI